MVVVSRGGERTSAVAQVERWVGAECCGSEDSKAGWDAAALASSHIFGGGVMGHVSRRGGLEGNQA